MNDLFLFGVLPYAALAVAGVGVAARRRLPATLGTRSSEFLEKRVLFWGSVPWHYAILAILAAHLVAALAPRAWGGLLADPGRLVVLEMAGAALGLWATFAMALLVLRRLASARLRAVTSGVDWVLLALLLAQVGPGDLDRAHPALGVGLVPPHRRALARVAPRASRPGPSSPRSSRRW